MFKKSRVLFFVTIIAIFSLLVGCGRKNQNAASSENQTNNELKDTIQIAGSTSVQPLSEELAFEFMQKNPNVEVYVAGGGSSAGIKAAYEKTADIGASSRELKEEEKKVKEFVIAKDSIAVIVHPDNPIHNITMEQLKKVFQGEITNWKQLGGKDAAISVIVREDGSGTRDAFQEIIIGKKGSFTDNAVIQNSSGALRTAVAENVDSIGFISMGTLNDKVKALKIDGVSPTKENVLNNSYKISRPFIYMTKEKPKGRVKSFIDFVLSSDGQDIIGREFIPIK